jgi:hypothetical protein
MRRTRRGLTWWNAWVPLLVVGGLLVLEPQAPLSPGGHKIALLAMTLLMYVVVMGWLRRNCGALIHEAYEREQKEGIYKTVQRESAMSDYEPWDDTRLPWQRHGHNIQRRW